MLNVTFRMSIRVDLGGGCWWRNVLVTVLAILIANFTLAGSTNIQKIAPKSKSPTPLLPLYVHISKHRQHMTLNYHEGVKIFHLYTVIECFCWNKNRQSTLLQCQSMRLSGKDLLFNIISTWVSLSRQLRVCAARFLVESFNSRLARRRSVTVHRIFIKFWNNIPVIAKIFFLENSKSENLKKILVIWLLISNIYSKIWNYTKEYHTVD